MKNRTYLPVIEHARAKGCSVEYGAKHIKVKSPSGQLITVLSANSSRECGLAAATIREIDRACA